jgi:hypothetical protein
LVSKATSIYIFEVKSPLVVEGSYLREDGGVGGTNPLARATRLTAVEAGFAG